MSPQKERARLDSTPDGRRARRGLRLLPGVRRAEVRRAGMIYRSTAFTAGARPSRQLFEQTIFPAKGSGFAIDSE